MENENEFETDDIYLAAYFLLAACHLDRKKKIGNKVIFVFRNVGGPISDIREAYYSGKAQVRPHDFAQKIIAMKNLCFS